jgi:hypothetical protein
MTRTPMGLPVAIVCLIVALAASLLAACAGSGSPRVSSGGLATPASFTVYYRENRSEAGDTVSLPVDRVWALLPTAYREIGFPAAASRDTADRTMFTPHLELLGAIYPRELTSAYIDCGRSPAGAQRADTYSMTFVILTRVRAADEGRTVIETLIDGRARDRVTSTNSVNCRGTGKLEKQIVDIVRRLGRSEQHDGVLR